MMNYTRKVILLLSATSLILSACGNDPNAASEANFETALNAHYAKKKECIRVGSEPNDEGIIQEFSTDGRAQNKQLAFYNSLQNSGLLETVTYQKDTKNFSGQVTGKSNWVGFKFSDEGKSYLRPEDNDFFSTGIPQLCYGTPQVVSITNFTEPADVMGVKASSVQYTYKLVDVAGWANDPMISTQYKWLAERLANQAIQKNDDMVLTNNGWVHHSGFKN